MTLKILPKIERAKERTEIARELAEAERQSAYYKRRMNAKFRHESRRQARKSTFRKVLEAILGGECYIENYYVDFYLSCEEQAQKLRKKLAEFDAP